MALKSILGIIFACIYIVPSTVTARTVWATDLTNGISLWTMYIVSEADNPSHVDSAYGLYIDGGPFPAIDPDDLLNIPPASLAVKLGDIYDVVTWGPDFSYPFVSYYHELDPSVYALIYLEAEVIQFSTTATRLRCVLEGCVADDPFTEYPSGIEFTTFIPVDQYMRFTAIATNVIPIPTAIWLFSSGLIGLIGIARRRKA